MREVKSKGRWPELVQTCLYDNGWGVSFVVDTVSMEQPCWSFVRSAGGDDYRLIELNLVVFINEEKDRVELDRILDLYCGLSDFWPDLEMLCDTEDASPEVLWRHIGRFPVKMSEDGLLTFACPVGGHLVEGHLDKRSRSMLRRYIETENNADALEVLAVLCDYLTDQA